MKLEKIEYTDNCCEAHNSESVTSGTEIKNFSFEVAKETKEQYRLNGIHAVIVRDPDGNYDCVIPEAGYTYDGEMINDHSVLYHIDSKNTELFVEEIQLEHEDDPNTALKIRCRDFLGNKYDLIITNRYCCNSTPWTDRDLRLAKRKALSTCDESIGLGRIVLTILLIIIAFAITSTTIVSDIFTELCITMFDDEQYAVKMGSTMNSAFSVITIVMAVYSIMSIATTLLFRIPQYRNFIESLYKDGE